MKERPILFTPENAQKCFDGTKTQTRRIVKLPRDRGTWEPFFFQGSKYTTSDGKPGADMVCITNTKTGKTLACQFGQAGDRLWVREPHAWPGEEAYLYRGNPEHSALVDKWRSDPNYPQIKWTPSIHMKREACRTVLELTDVRVERLQDCSEEDAIAEGIERVGGNTSCCPWRNYRIGKPGEMNMHCSAPSRSFMTLWESINGEGSWELNPWVWVLSFKPIQTRG